MSLHPTWVTSPLCSAGSTVSSTTAATLSTARCLQRSFCCRRLSQRLAHSTGCNIAEAAAGCCADSSNDAAAARAVAGAAMSAAAASMPAAVPALTLANERPPCATHQAGDLLAGDCNGRDDRRQLAVHIACRLLLHHTPAATLKGLPRQLHDGHLRLMWDIALVLTCHTSARDPPC